MESGEQTLGIFKGRLQIACSSIRASSASDIQRASSYMASSVPHAVTSSIGSTRWLRAEGCIRIERRFDPWMRHDHEWGTRIASHRERRLPPPHRAGTSGCRSVRLKLLR